MSSRPPLMKKRPLLWKQPLLRRRPLFWVALVCATVMLNPPLHAQTSQAQDPPLPTHLEPLPLGQLGAVPWGFGPGWFLLIGLGVPTLTWLGLAWERALDEDPHRLRRKALRDLRNQLARMQRGGAVPAQPQLHAWCHAAAR